MTSLHLWPTRIRLLVLSKLLSSRVGCHFVPRGVSSPANAAHRNRYRVLCRSMVPSNHPRVRELHDTEGTYFPCARFAFMSLPDIRLAARHRAAEISFPRSPVAPLSAWRTRISRAIRWATVTPPPRVRASPSRMAPHQRCQRALSIRCSTYQGPYDPDAWMLTTCAARPKLAP